MQEPSYQPWAVLNRLIDASLVRVREEGFEFKKRDRRSPAQKVADDDVLEYWVQQYVMHNPEQLGLKLFEGPLSKGPDFKGKVQGGSEKVDIEVEVRCKNYIKHGHHKDKRWRNVKVLIVLEAKEPDEATKKKLPGTIIHVDRGHFQAWYEEAAGLYARAKEPQDELNRNLVKLDIIAGSVRRYWLHVCPDKQRDMATCPDCEVCAYHIGGPSFEDLAFRFLQERGTGESINLAEISPEEVDDYCGRAFFGG